MRVFFTNNIDNDIAYLEDAENKHCSRVMRKKIGDAIIFIDGMGTRYEGEIVSINKRQTEIKILTSRSQTPQKPFIHIAIAPTKNMSRFEWFLEKATEIGISEITPIICDHSERKQIKIERCNTILISAMKQSLKSYLPKLNPVITCSDFITKDISSMKLLASYHKNNEHIISFENEQYTVLIGPEGDFSTRELALAELNHWTKVNISKHRLRTETAGIVACTLLNN